MKIIAYKYPQEFLENTLHLLEKNEIENNLIIGMCNGLIQNQKKFDGCVFLNAIVGNDIKSSSIKTLHKAIVTSYDDNMLGVKTLAEYYKENFPRIKGVVGKSTIAFNFSNWFGKQFVESKVLIVHKLESINPLPLSEGSIVQASMEDVKLIIDWSINFEKDANTSIKSSYNEILTSVVRRIETGNFYKLVLNGEIVSIAAIVRKLTNACIIGVVYTPSYYRGKGYATSCVQRLSEKMLESGYKYCGLFTDKDNPTSNNIYKKIGYVPIEEHSDIEFIE
jgi:hypothetical protein